MSPYNYGDPKLPARFWSKVRVLDNGCWEWTGTVARYGYGDYWHNGKVQRAHRVAYEALVGPITDETLDHLCRHRPCVNPSHLEPVSNVENVMRGDSPAARNARKTECVRGHLLSAPNGYRRSGGRRGCRACDELTCQRRLRNGKRFGLVTWNGKTQTIAAWARDIGIAREVLRNRLHRGWLVDRALTAVGRIGGGE